MSFMRYQWAGKSDLHTCASPEVEVRGSLFVNCIVEDPGVCDALHPFGTISSAARGVGHLHSSTVKTCKSLERGNLK